MKYSTKVSDAVHILSFIALNAKESLTSQAIAESVKTNPAFVRQMMSSLRNAGLLTSVKGHAKPALSRDAKDISLLEVYRAVEGDKPLRTRTRIRNAAWVSISSSSSATATTRCRKRPKRKWPPSACRISWTSTKNGWKSRDSDQRRKMPGPPRLSFRLAESYNESNSNYRILCISVCFKAGWLTCGN